MNNQKHYGLFTAIAMIVGIVIGSGIFFKADNILIATSGSVALGALVFCIAAISIVFGCLAISSLAALTDEPGGVSAYANQFINKKFASAFGWFMCFLYFPTLTVIVSWVVGIYVKELFHLQIGLEGELLIGFAWFVICYFFNILSARIGGAFQNFATVAKLLPLIAVGVLGLLWGNPEAAMADAGTNAAGAGAGIGWFAAVAPVAFAYDGWITATTIAHEIKDSKRNLPRALILSPLFVLALYLLYFIGISGYLGAEQIMALGDSSVTVAANNMFGNLGERAVLVFVIISVMGAANGTILGFIRVPYTLALTGMLPGSNLWAKTSPKTDMPVNSGLFSIVICLFWWVVHYLTTKYELFENSDVSEIAIAMSYLVFIVLYVQVFRLWRRGVVKGIWRGVIIPVLATIGAAFIIVGGMQDPHFLMFFAICFTALAGGYIYTKIVG